MNQFPGIKRCPVCDEVEHNPNICMVCIELGSWAETPDSVAWIMAHLTETIAVHLYDGVMYAGKKHEASDPQ